MKKILFLIVLTLMSSVCVAQRNTSSSRSSSPARSSVSTSRSSSNRSAYTPTSRSRTTSFSSSRSSNRNTAINSRSETRSYRETTNPTRNVGNTPRSQNNGSYARPSDRSMVAPPKSHAPHNVHHPHHPGHHAPHGMHPAPPIHHPIHHHRPIHMHHHVCYNWMVYDMYWYGYWAYARTYPFNDVVVYVNNKYPSTTVIAVNSDENYVYTIYRDEITNTTYFTITDQTDNLLVKTQVNRKYCRIMTDGNGVWLLRKNDRNPLYFIYQDGNLYQYEED